MKARVFLDTNILIYAAAGRVTNPAEYSIARQILEMEQFELSPLILGEFYSVVRKPQWELMSAADAHTWLHEWENHSRIRIDASLVSSAAFIQERYKIQFWDAAHIAASERLGVTVLYSEDMNGGQKYGSVTVVNPFKAQ
jgi:predicted nucleic acid-binding protein